MYKYINFIVLVAGLSIIKNSFNITLVIYLFIYYEFYIVFTTKLSRLFSSLYKFVLLHTAVRFR